MVAFVRVRAFRSQKIHTLKIERLFDRRGTLMRLSGEFWSGEGRDRAWRTTSRFGFAGVGSRGCRRFFAFSTGARRRVSQCFAARLISGNGCSGTRGGQKHPPIRATGERLSGGRGWRADMERCRRLLQVVTSINEASLLATAKSGDTPVLDTLYT